MTAQAFAELVLSVVVATVFVSGAIVGMARVALKLHGSDDPHA